MIRNLFQRIVKLFWLLPGFLLWAAFPPMCETLDVIFAMAPLLWSLRNADVKTNVRRWASNGMLFWVATLSWMPAIVKNGGPWPLVVLGWGLLSAYCTLYFIAFGYLGSKYWQWTKVRGGYGWRLAGIMVIEPILWAGLEIVRSRFGGGFAWNQLGVAAVNSGLGSPAALGGVYLLSALIIMVSGTLVSIVERILAPYFAVRRRKVEVGGRIIEVSPERPAFVVPKWLRSIETALPALAVVAAYSLAGDLTAPSEAADGPTLKVAMLQRNFPCCFREQEDDPLAVYSNLVSRLEMLRPDLVVMSESAMAEFGAIDGRNARALARRIGRRTGGEVLAGGGRASLGKFYNSAALYGDDGMQIYDKVHLVPFGEFIPGDKWITALQKLAPVGSCTPGNLRVLTTRGGVKLGVAICFEDTDSAQMRELARKGAQVLCLITNDSWFSDSNEALQHAWQARARAIETGLAVVRVGNSGVTGTIAPDGKAAWLVGEDGLALVDRQGTMFDRVRVAANASSAPLGCHTWYVLLGDWPIGGAFALLIAAMIMVKYTYYAKRRTLSM